MIGIRLQGRLGNQLFQYAFIYATAKKLGTGFYIDQYTERSVLNKYFGSVNSPAITLLFNINHFKNIFNFHLRRFYYRGLEERGKFSFLNYDYEAAITDIYFQDNAIYQGYFQSEIFFSPYQDLIRDKFRLKQRFVTQFQSKYKELYQNNSIVTIHIRRTDYQNQGHLNLGGDDLSLPLDYYEKAIERYNGQNVHFLFISDDEDFVNRNFKKITNKTISTDPEIMDFQHLLNADGCIISNSTFSWWGAWLNNKAGKIIYAPKYFMGWRVKQEVPQNIYPSSWNQIDFSD